MAVAGSLNPFRTLALHRSFRVFWAGQTTSQIGTWMQRVAQGWLAHVLSNSVGVAVAIGGSAVVMLAYGVWTFSRISPNGREPRSA